MTARDYWEKRALLRETEAYQDTDEVILRLRRMYGDAGKHLTNDAKIIFGNYMRLTGLDEKEAKKLLSAQESAELLSKLRREFERTGNPEALAKLNAPAYAYRISRAQALHKAVDAETTALAEQEQRIGERRLVKAVDDGYYKTMYDAAAEQEDGINFASLPQDAITEAVESRWKGENFSERVWKNRDVLAKEAGKIIDSGVASGRSVANMTRELSELMNVASYAAERLIRTETNRMHNDASLKAYGAMGVKEYRYLATLDARTCSVCGALDGKHFKISEAKTGVNFPPLHPNDRCTTVAYDPDEELDGVRTARDPTTGRNYKVPVSMSYEQWRGAIAEKYGASTLNDALDYYRRFKKWRHKSQ